MSSAGISSTVLQTDQEHGGVRFATMAILLIAFVIAFLMLQAVLRALPSDGVGDFALTLACIGALPISLALAALGERLLKQVWPSGMSLRLDYLGVEAQLAGGETLYIDWSKRFWLTNWYFSLRGFPRGGRERRLPSGWYCLACQVQQDEHRLVVYTYLPEKQGNAMVAQENYHQINPAAYYKSDPLRRRFGEPHRPALPVELLTGREGAYWLAEKRRWHTGLELTPDDFTTFMDAVYRHYLG